MCGTSDRRHTHWPTQATSTWSVRGSCHGCSWRLRSDSLVCSVSCPAICGLDTCGSPSCRSHRPGPPPSPIPHSVSVCCRPTPIRCACASARCGTSGPASRCLRACGRSRACGPAGSDSGPGSTGPVRFGRPRIRRASSVPSVWSLPGIRPFRCRSLSVCPLRPCSSR